jgi:hypothetical protein
VVGAEVDIVDLVMHDVPAGLENRVADGHQGAFGASSFGDAVVALSQVGPLGVACCCCRGTQYAAKPGVALSGSAGEVFAGGLVVAWTHAGPGREVSGGGESRHVGAGLGDDHLGGASGNAGDGDESVDRLGEALRTCLPACCRNLFVQRGNGGVDAVDAI